MHCCTVWTEMDWCLAQWRTSHGELLCHVQAAIAAHLLLMHPNVWTEIILLARAWSRGAALSVNHNVHNGWGELLGCATTTIALAHHSADAWTATLVTK
jgi:hypothetical protein